MFKSLARAARLSLASRRGPPAAAHASDSLCAHSHGCFHSFSGSASPFVATFLCGGTCHTSGTFLHHSNLDDAFPIGGRRCTYTWAYTYDVSQAYTPAYSQKSTTRRGSTGGQQQKLPRSRNMQAAMSSMSMLEQSLAADFIPFPMNDVQSRRSWRNGAIPRKPSTTVAIWASPDTSLRRPAELEYPVGIQSPSKQNESIAALASAAAIQKKPHTVHTPMFDPPPFVEDSWLSPQTSPPTSNEQAPVSADTSQPTRIQEPVVDSKSSLVSDNTSGSSAIDSKPTLSLEEALSTIRSRLDASALSLLTSTTPVQAHPSLPLITSFSRSKLSTGCFMDLSNRFKSDMFTVSSDPYTRQQLVYSHMKPFPEGTKGFLYVHRHPKNILQSNLRFRVTSSSDPLSFAKGRDLMAPCNLSAEGNKVWSVPLLACSPAIRAQLAQDNVLSQEDVNGLEFILKQMGGQWKMKEPVLFNINDEFCIDLGKYGGVLDKLSVWVVGEDLTCGKVEVGRAGAGLKGSILVRFQVASHPKRPEGRHVLNLCVLKILKPIVVLGSRYVNPKSPAAKAVIPKQLKRLLDFPSSWAEAAALNAAAEDAEACKRRTYKFLPEEGKILVSPITGRPWTISETDVGAQCLRFFWREV